MFTKEQYLEMILDELSFAGIKIDNKTIAYISKAKKDVLVKFYEILCDETTLWNHSWGAKSENVEPYV